MVHSCMSIPTPQASGGRHMSFSRKLAATLAIALTSSVFAVSPAEAAINRCGERYTMKTRSFDTYGGEGVQRARFRMKPGAPRSVCLEFLRVDPDWRTQSHTINFKDTLNGPSKMICAGLVCRWRSDDDKIVADWTFQANKRRVRDGWRTLHGGAVLVLAR